VHRLSDSELEALIRSRSAKVRVALLKVRFQPYQINWPENSFCRARSPCKQRYRYIATSSELKTESATDFPSAGAYSNQSLLERLGELERRNAVLVRANEGLEKESDEARLQTQHTASNRRAPSKPSSSAPDQKKRLFPRPGSALGAV
jgi:hypothetical protein